ncbi:hypothetical protein ACVWZV_006927 [Bradyrhizobium sp. GM5.1]
MLGVVFVIGVFGPSNKEIDSDQRREFARSFDRSTAWRSWLAAHLLDSAVSDRSAIEVVGATNAIERVDGALLEPGRFEKVVEITGRPICDVVDVPKKTEGTTAST